MEHPGCEQQVRVGRGVAYQVRSKRKPIFCHATAALAWGLWIVGKVENLHTVTGTDAGGRSHDDLTCHFGSLTQGVVQCGGLLFTDKLTTTMQLITSLKFEDAVAICDSSLHETLRRSAENTFTHPGAAGVGELSWKNDQPSGTATIESGSPGCCRPASIEGRPQPGQGCY